MYIQQLPSNYTHPMGVTGYLYGLYEDGELVVTALTIEELTKIMTGATALKVSKGE